MGSDTYIMGPGEGQRQPFMPGELFVWKSTGPANGGAMDFGELHLDAGVRVPEHVHHGNDEAYYILEGTYRFKVGEQLADVGPGTFVRIPKGTPHAWANVGSGPGRVVLVFTPGGAAGYFEELEPLIPDMMVGIADVSKVDPDVMAKVEAVFARYQYEIVGPPLL